MKKILALLSCAFVLSFSVINSFAITPRPRINPKFIRAMSRRLERVSASIKRSSIAKGRTKVRTSVRQRGAAATRTTHTTSAHASTSTNAAATRSIGTANSVSRGVTTITGTLHDTDFVTRTNNSAVSFVSPEMMRSVDSELASVRGYNLRVYERSRQLLLENEELFETFQHVETAEKLRFLDFLKKDEISTHDIEALNYWYSHISNQFPKVKSDLFQGLRNALARDRLNDYTAIFAKFKQARDVDQATLLRYLQNASDADMAAVEHWCQQPQSAVSNAIDFGVLMFLKEDPIGEIILTKLKNQDPKRITEKGYNEILAFEGDSEYLTTWMAGNWDGMDALRAAQEYFEADSYLAKLFFSSEIGKSILEDASAFVTDAGKERQLSANEMRTVFAEHFNLVDGGVSRWYAPASVAPGFPRYHIVVEEGGILKVLTEREIASRLPTLKIKARSIGDLEEMAFGEAFSTVPGRIESGTEGMAEAQESILSEMLTNSSRVDDIVSFLKEFGIKADDIEGISLRLGHHEVSGAHLHTNILLKGNRLFNYSQKVDFGHQGRALANILNDLNNELLKGNIFSRSGKKLFDGKRNFEEAIKVRL